MAFNNIQRIREEEVVYPSYFKEVKPSSLVFNILAYMYMNQIILDKKEVSDKFFSKLQQMETKSKRNDIEKQCIAVLNLIMDKKLKVAEREILKLEEQLASVKLSVFLMDLYNATINKLALDMKITQGNKQEIADKQEQSSMSIQKLYNNLITN